MTVYWPPDNVRTVKYGSVMQSDTGLVGRSVVITGASKGIGLSMARAFARESCALHLVARSKADLETAANELSAAHSVKVSITDVDLRAPNAVSRIVSDCPNADVLINNAGDIPSGTIEEVDDAAWKDSWDVKIFSSIALTRAYLPSMKDKSFGIVINVTGIAGDMLDATYIAGSVGNAALTAFTKCVGAWSPQFGVRVVGINPGSVQTSRLERIQKKAAVRAYGDESRWAELAKTLPFGRAADPDEIASAAVYLASNKASYISGAILTIDGGISAGRRII